jgi:deoxyribodipyrimidine photo-lyase
VTSVAWLRRDLRLDDNPALAAALAGDDEVVPLFVRDPGLADGIGGGSRRMARLDATLVDLDTRLRAVGGRLIVRPGRPEEVLPAVVREAGARQVHAARDVTRYALRRDEAVGRAVPLILHPGLLIAEPGAIGERRVFAAFHRRWLGAEIRRPIDAPRRIRVPQAIPSAPLVQLGVAGEADPLDRARAFAATGAAAYAADRDRLDLDGTSHLSADLHFGTISPRRLVETVPDDAYRRQLAWRDWAHHLLWWRPEAAWVAWQPGMRAIPWRDDRPDFTAWQEGRTGFPAVDAAMRQLAETGWVANRARLIVASFLTRELFLDWRLGARHFLRTLVDGDVANNAANWQWVAGVGTDAAPYFRILDPSRQGERFDPHGAWVRRWVPELRGVPDAFTHRPWDAPSGPPARYRRRIVDRAMVLQRVRSTFRAARHPTMAISAVEHGPDRA